MSIFRSSSNDDTSVAPCTGRPEQRSTDTRLLNAHVKQRELASRSGDGLEVTLSWHPEINELIVCVCDHRQGAYFEIRPERHLALEVYYHPYAYVDLSDVHYRDDRLAV